MTGLAPQLESALAFAEMSNRGGVQAWMLWPGWMLHVGCDVCADDGPDASCWGVEGCHSYPAGCGCSGCAAQQTLDEQRDRDREFAALTAGLERPAGTLRDELHRLAARISEPTGRKEP